MAVRRESVELSLQDVDFTSGMAKAAASTALLNRELHNLDGSSVKADRSTSALGEGGIKKTGDSARRSSADLNQYTGRLSLLATAATTIGPALLPIGAVALPAVTALAGGLGALVGGVGTAVLAFHGLGGALKALDAYQLDPTDANLKKVNETLGQMGPAAQGLVLRLDQLEPVLTRLQHTAQDGLFPGVNSGLDELLTMVPLVRDVVSRLSVEMGNLAADGGASLAHDADWQRFFEFIRTDAAPTLDAFARATGNVVAGLGSILVAFRPLSDDFTSGMLDMSRSFREWAAGLGESGGFQKFVGYIRDNGPAVRDFFSAMGQALVALAQAAAPWGSVMLPVLTDVAKVFTLIAGSPIGPALYTAAAAMLAMKAASNGLGKMSTSLGLIGVNSEKASKGLAGLAGKAAGILLVAQALGTLANTLNTGNGIKTNDLARDIDSITNGHSTGSLKKLSESLEDVNERGAGTVNALFAIPSAVTGVQTSFAGAKDTIDAFDQQLAQMVESGQADKAAKLFGRIRDAAAAHGGVSDSDVVKSFGSYRTALDNLNDSATNASHGSSSLSETLGLTGSQAWRTANQVKTLSDALAGLSGWLDKRDALRNYQQSLDDFGGALKKNIRNFDITTAKGRENQAALDGVASSVAQVASQMKSPARQRNFINGAIGDLREMATKATPQARAAIRGVIRELRGLHTTPATPALDVNNKPAEAKIKSTKRSLREAAHTKAVATLDANRAPAQIGFQWLYGQLGKANKAKASPKILVDPGNAASVIAGVQARLNALRDRTVHITTVANKINAGGGGGGGAHPAGADGMTVPGARHPYGDKVLAYLAPGEEVITNRSGQADRFRPLLKAINAGALADGGTVGHHRSGPTGQLTGLGSWLSISEAGTRISNLTAAQIRHLGKQVDDLSKKNLGRFGKALDKAADATQKRLDAEVQASDSVKGSIRSNLTGDLFGSGGSGSAFSQKFAPGSIGAVNSTLKQQIADARATTALEKQLRARGVSGPALQELIEKGGVTALRSFAASSNSDLKSYQSLYGQRGAAVNVAANTGADVLGMTSAIAQTTQQVAMLTAVTRAIEGLMKTASHRKHHHVTAEEIAHAINKAAKNARK